MTMNTLKGRERDGKQGGFIINFRIYNPEVPPFTITESKVFVETKFKDVRAQKFPRTDFL